MADRIELTAAVKTLKSTCADKEINAELADLSNQLLRGVGSPGAAGSPLQLYTEAVQGGFYSEKPLLDPKYRECSVLALLVSQGAELNLAIHVFIALMMGIQPEEIINIVFLAGIYCGVNRFTNSLRVVAKTFAAVIKAASDNNAGAKTPRGVIRSLAAALQPAAPQTPPPASPQQTKGKKRKKHKKQKRRSGR